MEQSSAYYQLNHYFSGMVYEVIIQMLQSFIMEEN